MKKMKMVIPALALAASMSMNAFAAGEAQQDRPSTRRAAMHLKQEQPPRR